ncbi:protein mono-ADP-ribosyltransferase PARP10 [Rhinoderma darwinii]|uniref:protein mono-ADP-ribosyltransferase PARP10 n=1 Tax=Rhinoderma darwinii TaxID=43563 RepID=UPI003F669DD7
MEGSGDGLQEPTTNLKSENMEVQEEMERDCQEEVWSDPVTEQLPEDQARETEQNIGPCEAEKTEEVTQENMKTRDDPPWRATQDADVLMESSELRFLQEYHHELLAGMDQVTIVPLEAQDRCGFKVAGDTFSCRTAVELLHHVVSSLSSRAVTLQYPGVSLFLLEDEGQRSILETERQYQCIIDTSRLSWKVTGCKDVDPWRFVDVSGADSSPVQSYMVEDVSEAAGTRRAADIEDIKAFASLLKNSKSEDNKEVSATTIDLIIKKDDDEVDLYSDPKGQEEDASETGDEELEQVCKMSRDEFTDRELDEEAQLLLAIQMSMDTQDPATEEQDLQKALELSLREQVMEEVEEPLQRALEMSLRNSWARADDETFPSEEDDVSGDEMARAVNTAEIKVLAGDETGLVVACTAIRKAITGQLCTVTLGGARDLRYGAQILSALESKHKVTITVQDGQAQIQGFLQNPLKCQEELSQILRALHAGGRSHGGIVTLDQQQTSILIPVSEKSAEYGRVMELFTSTLQDLKPLTRVLQVQKVQNTLLYNQYQLKKQSMLGQCPRTPIERTLYHGTTEDGAKEICHHGFDRSFCGKNATLFGQGVYFAVHSAVSARDIYSPPSSDGHKYILVAQVLTGEFTLGKADMKTPPIKLDPGDDVPQRYDSLTNNLQKPSVFVIFNDTQAYPQYLITCCNQKN